MLTIPRKARFDACPWPVQPNVLHVMCHTCLGKLKTSIIDQSGWLLAVSTPTLTMVWSSVTCSTLPHPLSISAGNRGRTRTATLMLSASFNCVAHPTAPNGTLFVCFLFVGEA